MTNHSHVYPAGAESISRAADMLRSGGLVAFPTETVYGLGADATNDQAVIRIFAAKQRPRFNPLIVHVRNTEEAEKFAVLDETARALARNFWPGPLTLVLPRRESAAVSLLASAGLDTIAIRVPAHKVAQALLAACGLPLAAPSANPSGRISATTAQHVAGDLDGAVDLILDGGTVPVGIESTIVGFENSTPVLLRAGAIPRDKIEALAGPITMSSGTAIRSPGQLLRHYAPKTPLRLNANDLRAGEGLLAFGPAELPGATNVRNLSRAGDLTEAAANLFAMLRELDKTGCKGIAAMPVPERGLGEAINDRLRRAATPPET